MILHKKIKDVLALSAGRYLFLLFRMISGIFIAKILGPHLRGMWNGLMIIRSYSQYSDLGISLAMRREIPILNSVNNRSEAKAIKDVTFGVNLLAGCILAIFIFLYTTTFHSASEPLFKRGLYVVSIIIILERLSNFCFDVMRGEENFIALGKLFAIQASLILILSFVLVLFFSLDGLYIVHLLSNVLLVCVLYQFILRHLNPTIDYKRILSLIKVGFPLMLSALGWLAFNTSDRIVILKMLGSTDLGLYSIATIVTNFLASLPHSIKSVMQPKVLSTFAKNEFDVNALQGYLIRPARFISSLMAILVVIVCIGLPYLISNFLPAYIDGLIPAQILIIGVFFTATSLITHQIITAIKKFNIIIYTTLLFSCLNLVTNVVMIYLGYKISAVAIVTLVTNFGYCTTLNFWVLRNYFNYNLIDNIVYNIRLIFPLVYCVSAYCIVSLFFSFQLLWELFIGELCFGALVFPLMISSYKQAKQFITI